MTYRFYKIWQEQKWWRISRPGFYSVRHSEAALFTEDDWQAWGEAEGLQREAVEEPVKGEQVRLPGLGE